VNVEEVIGSVVSVNVAMPRFRDFPGGLQSKDVSTRSSTYRRRGIAANASANSQRNAGASDTVGSTFSYAGRASLPNHKRISGSTLGRKLQVRKRVERHVALGRGGHCARDSPERTCIVCSSFWRRRAPRYDTSTGEHRAVRRRGDAADTDVRGRGITSRGNGAFCHSAHVTGIKRSEESVPKTLLEGTGRYARTIEIVA